MNTNRLACKKSFSQSSVHLIHPVLSYYKPRRHHDARPLNYRLLPLLLRLDINRLALGPPEKVDQADVALRLSQQPRVLGTRVAAKDAVHLLEADVLGLGQVKVDPGDAGGEEAGEEDVGAPGQGLEHGRHEEGDGKVVEPVGRGADRGTAGADAEREDLRDDNPRGRAPAEAKGTNVDPDQDHGRPARGGVVGPVVLELGYHDADRDHGQEHDDGASVEHGLAAELVDEQLKSENGLLSASFPCPFETGNPFSCNSIRLTMAGMVDTKNTTPVTPVASRAMVPSVKPKLIKTLVA